MTASLGRRLAVLESSPDAGLRGNLAVLTDAEIAAVLEQHQAATGGDLTAWCRGLADAPGCPGSVAGPLRHDPELAQHGTRLAVAAWLRRAA